MKIDLSKINAPTKKPEAKNKPSTKSNSLKLRNPFKRQKGPTRDTDGKFTSGSGGLRMTKKLYNKRALSLIAVVALVGGLFVFSSFAASANGSFVTEMYQRCYNQMKTSGSDYTYWLNRLDKGESRNTIWATFVAATGKPCSYPYPPVATSPAPNQDPSHPPGTQAATMTAAQVTSLYKELFNRDPSKSEVDYWIDKSKTWTAVQVKAHLQASDEYFRKHVDAKLQEAQAWKTLADAHVVNAKNYNGETYKLSSQAVVTRENLATIATKERAVRDSIGQVGGGLDIVKTSLQKATTSKSAETSTFKTIVSTLTTSSQSLNAYLKNITADYARAQKTYEANLKFFQQVGDRQRQAQDCRNRGGTPTFSGGCTMPVPQPANSPTPAVGGSGGNFENVPAGVCYDSLRNRQNSTDVAGCQKTLNNLGYGPLTVDGNWGNQTNSAYERWKSRGQSSEPEAYKNATSVYCGQSSAGVRYTHLVAPLTQYPSKQRYACSNSNRKVSITCPGGYGAATIEVRGSPLKWRACFYY